VSPRALVMCVPGILALSGCAAQLGGGAGMATADAAPRGVLVADGRLFQPRRSGPLLGAYMMTAVGQDRAHPLRVRTIGLAAGYHGSTLHPFPRGITGEGALEVGIGAPLREEWDGLGASFGMSGTALYRLWGPGDATPRFDTLTTLVDLALTLRGAVWSAPEGTSNPTRGEASLGLALRVTISTDLTTSRPPEDEDSMPAEQSTTSPQEFK